MMGDVIAAEEPPEKEVKTDVVEPKDAPSEGEPPKKELVDSFSGKLEKYVNSKKDKEGNPLDDKSRTKLLNRLARYASDEAVIDAMINAQNKISDSRMVRIPGENSTKEEIAEFRAAIGVPDDPKGYDLNLGDGLVIGDEDREGIDQFLEIAHAGNFTNQQVKDGLKWYYKAQEDAIAKRHEADAQFRASVEEELRQEWGPEYQANRNLMANFLSTDFDEGVAELIVGARLADGTPLANHPGFLRGLVAKARAANPISALVPGSGTKQHDQMISEIEMLEAKMRTDGALKGKDEARYLKLVSLRDKVPER